MNAPTKSKQNLIKSLRLFADSESPIELRYIDDHNRIKIGLFSSPELAAKEAKAVDKLPTTKAVYVVMNPIETERQVSNVFVGGKGLKGAKDEDVTRRRWILVDCDPIRPSDTSSTDEEKKHARKLANKIAHDLFCEHDFPGDPIVADSSNGFHLLYRVDLEANEETKRLVESFLNKLGDNYSTHKTKVDRGVYNASRITKLYGTTSRKGKDTKERPHRKSKLLESDSQSVLSLECLENYVGDYRIEKELNDYERSANSGSGVRLNAEVFIQEKSLQAIRRKSDGEWDKWEVVCPFNHSHNRGEAMISQNRLTGAVVFKCHHDSCQSYDWEALKIKVGAPSHDCYDFPKSDPREDFEPIPESERNKKPIDKAFGLVSIWQLRKQSPKLNEPIVDGLIRRGETLNVVAAPKSGKSWLAGGLAICLATGDDWLGFSTKQSKVLVIDNELHEPTLANRYDKIAKAYGKELETLSDQLFARSLRGQLVDIHDIEKILLTDKSFETIDVVILDALYRFQPKGFSENDNHSMMEIYNRLDRIAARLDASIVVVHHSSKGNQNQKSSIDVGAGAGSQARATDAHLTIRQHEEDGLAVVNADVRNFAPVEQFSIRWDFPVWSRSLEEPILKRLSSNQDLKQANQDATAQDEIRKILSESENGLGRKAIQDKVTFGYDRTKRNLNIMVSNGEVETVDIPHQKREGEKIQGFRLVKTQSRFDSLVV